MSNTNSVYDAPTREIYLLENVAIQGRKTELRQLLKLLNLAKTGQPKAALITGDAGIGKTALLEAFTSLVYEGVYCRVLDMGKMTLQSPEEVYVSIIEKLQAEANGILDEALVAVNEITQELDLRWERQDLIRAIALVKLQESIGGKDAISQEQLVKAIRSQVPAVKKLKFSVNESIEKLVDLIVNPWVMVATSLLNPMSPQLQEAIKLAEALRDNNFSIPDETKLSQLLSEPRPAVSVPAQELPVAREPFPPISDPEALERSGAETGKSLPTIIDTEFGVIFEEGVRPIGEADFQSTSLVPHQNPVSTSQSASSKGLSSTSGVSYTPARAEIPSKPIKDPLIKHLMTVFNFINATIENIDSALLLIIDEWDRIQHTPQQNELKEFFSELLYQITEQKNYHFMAVVAARTEGESYTLGGALYNHFRTKLLLDALNEGSCRKLVRNPLKDIGVELDEDVNHRIFRLSKGNPFWQLKIGSYMKERVEGNRLRHVDMNFFEKLGVDKAESLFELSFTRLKLTFLNDEESLYKVIAALIKHFGEGHFSANRAIKEISASQGFTDGYVFEVLRALFRHDFIRQVEITHQERRKTDGRALEDRSRRHDPYYAIQSRFILEFLKEKTRAIETDISTDEKIMYLKKVIPLSVKSGDLDREKTMEVLALGDAMGNGDLVKFLEDIFIEYLHDDKAVVRVTALNNIALIDSPRAREALFSTIRDRDSMVREYAARNLSMLSQKGSSDPNLAGHIIDAMLQAIDDESEAVRAQVYTTLSKYRWHRDLTSVFVKGMSDACDGVRLTSIKNLADVDAESPYIFGTLMDAVKDPMPEVRRYACIGLQRFPGSESIEAIVKILQTDTDSAIRALAADSLSRMEDNKAFIALVNALRKEAAEDVKLAVVRALGKRRGWQTEAVLQEALQSADWENMPVFTWACVRSLGQVGGTERSRDLLKELKGRVQNQIIYSAIELAIHRISEHIEELHQMERQLEEATPIAVAIPSEYAEEVQIPEEEKIQDQELLSYDNVAEEEPEVSAAYEAERPKTVVRNGAINRAQSLLKLPFEK
ncbi:MAG: oxidoreductase/HEAT repeat-containing protein [Vampirovibrio sp.]|nr:oxidoreductase/HEAT repeat-containing protein [Vampirovibrio sp.]